MKFFNSPWMSFLCMLFNAIFASHAWSNQSWFMFLVCTSFTALCGYNFWKQMGESDG